MSGTPAGARADRRRTLAFVATILAEAVVGGMTPTWVVTSLHAARLARRFAEVPGVWRVAATWAVASGAAAGIGVVAAGHVLLVLARTLREAGRATGGYAPGDGGEGPTPGRG